MDSQTHDSSGHSTRRQILAAMGGAGAVSLAGCTGDGDDGDDGDDTAGDDGTDGGDNEITVAVGANPDTLDLAQSNDAPSNAVYGHLVYQTLVANDYDLSFAPQLATDWEVADDEVTWTLQLREGVEFHNGDEFTADDVAFSVERFRGTVNDDIVNGIAEVNVVDDFTVEIVTESPQAQFLTDMSALYIYPEGAEGLSTTAAEDDFNFEGGSIGTGPFELDTFASEDRVVLSRYDNHWAEEENPWQTATFQVVTENVSQEEAIQNGEVDVIDSPRAFELSQWNDDEIADIEAVGFDLIGFPTAASPFNNQKLRRGMARLVNRSDVIEAIYSGRGTPLAGPISPGLTAFYDQDFTDRMHEEFVGFDIERGNQLIQEALEEEGVEPPINIEVRTNVNEERELWMQEVTQTWDETEFINAELNVIDFPSLVDFITAEDGLAQSSDVVIGIGWTGGSDPNGHIEDLYATENQVPNGNNWSLYSNEEADSLIEEGQETIETDARVEVYRELQELLIEESPHAWLWTTDRIHVVDPDSIEAWSPHPNSSLRFDGIFAPERDSVTQPL